MAWALGEASEFEKAEIERLLADNPELAAFARRIQAVHGLLGDAHQPEPATDEWKLSPERRATVTALFGDDFPNPVSGDAPLPGPGGGKPRRWRLPLSLVAAVLIIGLVAGFAFQVFTRAGSSRMMAWKRLSEPESRSAPLRPDVSRDLAAGAPVNARDSLEGMKQAE